MAAASGETPSKRYGGLCGMKPDQFEKYKELHKAVWPKVLERLTKSNVRNFTIYYDKDHHLLFSHMEYIGNDYDKDMKDMSEDKDTIEWWKINMPLMAPLHWKGPYPYEGGDGGGHPWWTPLEEVFHDGHSAVKFK